MIAAVINLLCNKYFFFFTAAKANNNNAATIELMIAFRLANKCGSKLRFIASLTLDNNATAKKTITETIQIKTAARLSCFFNPGMSP